jgi:hypothetical protein
MLRQRFPATLTLDGELIRLTVELLDDWARIAYAALAYAPVADALPARLVVSYAFMAYIHMQGVDLHVVAGGKRLQLAVEPRPPIEPPPHPVFIASQHAVLLPHGTLTLAQEAPIRTGPLATLHTSPHVLASVSAVVTPRPELERSAILLPRPPVFVPHFPPERLGTRTIAREDWVDAVLPCRELGGLYLEEVEGRRTAIGCRDALKLGEPSLRAFEELPGLKDPAFRVFRSLQQPGRFLLVPTTWRVGRYGAGVVERAFRPMMMLYATLDNEPAKDRYNLTATLVADVGAAQLARLRAVLAAHAPAHVAVDLVLPTDSFVAARVSFAWTVPDGMPAPQTSVVADSFTVTMTMDAKAALLVIAAIGHAGISGQVVFALPDGTELAGALQLDGEVVGPAETGPVTVKAGGGSATLRNRTAQAVNVFGLVVTDAAGALHDEAVNATLAPGTTLDVTLAAPFVAGIAEARPTALAPIETLDLFVEDIVQAVLFVNQLNFANHNITSLAVLARVKGLGPGQQQPLAEGETLTLTFTIPVTAYLDRRTLEFALAITTTAGTVTTPWRERDLSSSAVVGITSDLI